MTFSGDTTGRLDLGREALAALTALAGLAAALGCGADREAGPGPTARSDAAVGGDGGGAAGDGGGITIDGGGPCAATACAPTFSVVFREVFAPNGCTQPTCHGAQVDLALLDEDDAYRALVDVPGGCPNMVRVRPGSLEQSYLWHKIAPGRGVCGVKMPPDGRELSPADLERVRAWILAGAPR